MTDPEAHPLVLQSRIPASAIGQTLLSFLSERFRYHGQAGWRAELQHGRLQLDGRPAHGDEVLRVGMRLRYEKQHREPAVDVSYRLIHRDEALVVVDKPAHLPMHADGPFIRNTLIWRLREQLADRELQLAHRLDRETSGVCVVARSKTVQASIQAQFLAGTVQKTYLAVVHGLLQQAFVADQPIGHAQGSAVTLRRSAAPDATAKRTARTRFEPLTYGADKTLVRCHPETGRTHQIRVHLEAAGHPVVGDKLYGHPDQHYLDFVRRMKTGGSVFTDEHQGPNRHLLHAGELRLMHPTTGEPTSFVAPTPTDFASWLEN